MKNNISEKELTLLKIQAKFFPTINEATTEIINLSAILKLPKGTEHFLSDIHGEDEAFSHVIRNASGTIKNKIDELFGSSILKSEKQSLATLIYYPEEMLEKIKSNQSNLSDWYKITLYRLVEICRSSSSLYTRSKVRKALPRTFSYIMEELLNERYKDKNRENYFDNIVQTIIDMGKAEEFIIELSKLIQRFVIDRLHIIGDIFDRGKGADKIFDMLLDYHSVDVQWGNHDIVWMGAAAGCEACISNTLRVSLRYGNLRTIEEGYGINLYPLANFAMEVYKDDPCTNFVPKLSPDSALDEKDISLISKMHKAITIIQLKLEGQIIKKWPQFQMEERLLLDKINFDKKSVIIDNKEYLLEDTNFPTLNKNNPNELSVSEKDVIKKLKVSYLNNEKLQKHTKFLFSKGSMYLNSNGNLLYHGCIPVENNGDFSTLTLDKKEYYGKALLEAFERYARKGYFQKEDNKEKDFGKVIMWYLWNGPKSPLYGKDKMATFESYFIKDKKASIENKNPYFDLRMSEEFINKVLEEFDLRPDNSHVINGHVPVENPKGENPVKANGKLIVIDGGFSIPYRKTTGIAGYTLIYNSKGFVLAAHEPFHSKNKAIEEERDIVSSKIIIEKSLEELLIKDTNTGKELTEQILVLKNLVTAYEKGLIKEKN